MHTHNVRHVVGNVAKGAGVAVLAIALASPALAQTRLGRLIMAIEAENETPLEPSGRLVVFDRSQFFALLGREDPRSPN